MIPKMFLPRRRQFAVWSETWIAPETRLQNILKDLRANGEIVRLGGDYERWDLEVSRGVFGASRLLMAVEDQGAGTQYVRFRCWPKFSPLGISLALLFGVLAVGAGLDRVLLACAILGSLAGVSGLLTFRACAASMSALLRVVKQAGLGSS